MDSAHKIDIIIYAQSENNCYALLEDLSKLEIPESFFIDVLLMKGSGRRAAIYNQAMHSSNAQYKIYMEESCRIVNFGILRDLLYLFQQNKKVGCVGLYGSEMPINGDFRRNKKRFGIYGYRNTDHEVKIIQGKNPLWKQYVHCIDDGLIATSHDVEWDEDVQEGFLAAAHCCQMRKQGYKIAVPMQNYPWCTFGKLSSYLDKGNIDECFSRKYKKIYQPLVSILIPTYNQSKFFSQALDSALTQDYQNIEIIVGDDSTNKQTKELLESKYLNRYENIRYYCHGGPLGGNGLKNFIFVQNKARGEYVNSLFHDDLFTSSKISRMMEIFAEDLDEEIGMVTSARNKIDSEDKVIGRIGAWQPAEDEVLTPHILVDSILGNSSNYIGEMSTVLLRKGILKNSDGRMQGNCFCDVLDRGNGDVSTFLEVAHKGKNTYFIRDALSMYRMHNEQNTYNVEVVFHSVMGWLSYIVTAWLNHVYVPSEERVHDYMDTWYRKHSMNIEMLLNYHNYEMKADKAMLLVAYEAAKNKNYKKLEQCAVEYINRYGRPLTYEK